MLLLLAERPAHGYEIIERLSALPDAPSADRGHLYRSLRRLEDQGLVTSTWHLPEAGAARHTYTLTASGLQALDAWTDHIRAARARLGAFLELRKALRTTEPPTENPPARG